MEEEEAKRQEQQREQQQLLGADVHFGTLRFSGDVKVLKRRRV